jgi:hypothetical protein
MTRVFLFSISSMLLAATALAQPKSGPPAPNGGPFSAIQDQIDELSARVNVLESDSHSPPNSSVEGRTYCSELTTTSFVGAPDLSLEVDRVSILRAEVTFTSGVLSGNGISNWQAVQDGNGQIDLIQNPPPLGMPGPIVGQTYVQSGRKIDLMVFTTPWSLYVSADGSLIQGTRIFTTSLPPFSFAGLSTIVYVEDATGAGCNPEVIL